MSAFNRMTRGEIYFQYFAMGIICLFCVSVIYPFIYVLSISFSSPEESIQAGFHLYPKHFSLTAYKQAFNSSEIWIGYFNTGFRTVVGTILSLFVMMLGAYVLSKKYLPHRNFYTMLIVITMFMSGGLIPIFLLVKNLGLYDTRWALIIPNLINTYYMIIMRNFFMELPQELEDSAKIDGANDIQVLLRIMMPLSKPILATIGLWLAVGHWNEWFHALIYIQDPHKIVLQTYLRRLIIENDDVQLRQLMNDLSIVEATPESIKAAVLMLVTIPILCVYPFIQKYFVKGIMVGSLKG